MKKIFLTILLIISIFSFLYSIDTRDNVLSIPVEFTSDKNFYIGFSDSLVNSTIEPKEKKTSATFTADSTFENYSTGTFYLYFQLFTADPIEVVISSHHPLTATDGSGKTLHYYNSGLDTSSNFSGSNDTRDAIIISDAETSLDTIEVDGISYSIPSYYNRSFNFSIPIDENVTQSSYSGSLTVTVRSL